MTIAADRKALVTGGASGFGLHVARRLADHGARVVIGDVSRQRLEQAARADARLVPIDLDVTGTTSVRDGIAQAESELGGLDTLLNCAGVIHIKPLEDVTEADWDLTLDVNLKGAFLVSQAAAPLLKASGRGRIVSISSDAGRRGYPWITAYVASKFGLIGLSESLAVELAPHQVTVNCVCPCACPTTSMGQGLVTWKSEFTGRPEAEILAAINAAQPLGRAATEDDITNAILYFLSDEASFITGVALDVDGGEHLGYIAGTS